MFDANLCGIHEGENILVKFTGKAGAFGDDTNIIAGTYECRVVNRTGIDEEMTIVVKNPAIRKAGKGKSPKIKIVNFGQVGSRLVTFEGYLNVS